MKIKLVSVIVMSLLVSLTITSCLSTGNEKIEYSSDDTINAFALSAVGGVNDAFTIDQANNKIHNINSIHLVEISAHFINQKKVLHGTRVKRKFFFPGEFSERELIDLAS